jgi:hypothetical protein
MLGVTDSAHPQEVFRNVIAAARSELDVVNTSPGSALADLAGFPEHRKTKPLHRLPVNDPLPRSGVSAQPDGTDVGTPVGQNTQEDAQRAHEATPAS